MLRGEALRRWWFAALAAGFVGLPDRASMGADHRDGPRVTDNASMIGALDLNDLYLFTSPANRDNTVMVLSTGGAGVGLLTPPVFFPGAVYEFRISNDADPTTDEIVFQFVFSNFNAALRQTFTMMSVNPRTGQSSRVAQGVTGNRRGVQIRGGGRVSVGIFDDPFFFDVNAFSRFRTAVQTGLPLSDRVAPFLPPSIPNNFFGNFNILGIVVELPRHRLQSARNNPNISAWIRVLTPEGVQFDRMGRPGINTVLGFGSPANGLPSIQDTFNSLTPADDTGLRPAAAQRMNLYFGLPLADATALSEALLPDVLTFRTTDSSGFLNGRRLADDVIDAELALLTDGALTSDRTIDDSVFSRTFPYVGPPLPRPPIR